MSKLIPAWTGGHHTPVVPAHPSPPPRPLPHNRGAAPRPARPRPAPPAAPAARAGGGVPPPLPPPPHQNRDFVLACHHAAINADIHHPGVVVLGDAAPVGEQVAPAVEPVPPRRRQLIKGDIVAGDDVLFHRAGADDLAWNAVVEHVAAEPA